jgi:hypothetical protein
MISFYRRLTPGAGNIFHPQNELLKGAKKRDASMEWSEQAENAFRESKLALADATMLAHPVPGAYRLASR